MAYPDSVLRRGEHVLAHRRPHPRMLVVPALVAPVAAFLAAFLAAIAGGVPSESARTVVRVAVVVVALAAVVWFGVVPLLRWRCTHFVVTDRRLLIREGVLSRESVDVAGASITAVRSRAAGRERLVGSGTLVVATASAGEPWEFAGLGHTEQLAGVVEEMAGRRGGLRAAEDADDEDLDDEGLDDGDGLESEDGDDWGAWSDDPDDPDDPEDAEEPEEAEADEEPASSRRGFRTRGRAGRTSR